MSSISVTQSDHDVTFHIHETKPYGVHDVRRTVTIPLDRAHSVPPYNHVGVFPSADVSLEVFWIPQLQQWIGFHFSSYRERASGPNEEDYSGPYAFPDLAPPEDATGEAGAGQQMVCRIIRL